MDWRNFKEGDIIMVHKLPPYGLLGFPAPIIRRLTHCYYNHVAIITSYMGQLFVTEAVDKGFVPTMLLSEYLKENGVKRDIAILRPKKERPIMEVYGNMHDIVNKKYDFKSLLWYQLIYQLTGHWKGKRGNEAENAIYCSEAIAEAYPDIFPEPWKVAPDKIFFNDNLQIVFESDYMARITFNKKYPYK